MEQTNPSDNINKGFAYNVAKDIANLEMAVESLKDAPKPSAELAQPQPDVIPEGLEVIKFEVPKLFEQHVLNKCPVYKVYSKYLTNLVNPTTLRVLE